MRADDFFGFLAEREQIRLRKEADLLALEQGSSPQGPPWTSDPILQKYKFTNVKRHHDRTSNELIKSFYGPNFNDGDRTILMNCALFRYFGTIEFARAVGWQSYDEFDFEKVKTTAKHRMAQKQRVFTGAYVVTNQGISAPKEEVVVDYFLRPLHEATPEIVKLKNRLNSWQAVADRMSLLKGFGGSGFMTKEVLLDTMYTSFWKGPRTDGDTLFSLPWDIDSWTPIGPGARRGAARVANANYEKPLTEDEAMVVIEELHHCQDHFTTNVKHLYPTDIQFQLCEFDKYERVRLGQGKPRSVYKKG